MPPHPGCPGQGPPSRELTGVFCRVPSTQFSQAPWYPLPAHLCRFRVRSIAGAVSWNGSAASRNPLSGDDPCHPSHPSRPGTINPVPIAYAFRPRLRGRLTLRGLALRRNPWAFGGSVSHTPYRYSCQHSHFRYLQAPSRVALHRPTERSATTPPKEKSAASVYGLSPGTSSAQDGLFRPVSYYAFFKRWLLLSQRPGCLGLPTSFPT